MFRDNEARKEIKELQDRVNELELALEREKELEGYTSRYAKVLCDVLDRVLNHLGLDVVLMQPGVELRPRNDAKPQS